MASVNIEEELWKEFLKQSIDMGRSASERISEFIKRELKHSDRAAVKPTCEGLTPPYVSKHNSKEKPLFSTTAAPDKKRD